MSAIIRARLLINELGAVNALFLALNRFLWIISRGRARVFKYYFVAQPVAPVALVKKTTGSVTIRKVEQGDAEVKTFPRPAEVIQDRYRQGAHCFAAYKQAEFVGYIWLLLHTYKEDEVRCHFTPLPVGESAWDFDVHVETPYRLGRLFARLWDTANEFLHARGFRWTLSRISAFNPISLTSHVRMGSKILGSAVFVCLGSWQLMLASVRPFIHFSTASYPQIWLSPID